MSTGVGSRGGATKDSRGCLGRMKEEKVKEKQIGGRNPQVENHFVRAEDRCYEETSAGGRNRRKMTHLFQK